MESSDAPRFLFRARHVGRGGGGGKEQQDKNKRPLTGVRENTRHKTNIHKYYQKSEKVLQHGTSFPPGMPLK